MKHKLGIPALAAVVLAGSPASAQTTITVATVDNADMAIMQRLSPRFEEQNPDIDIEWVVHEENVLRQRVTTDIATGGGRFDVVTIGTYEAPIWAARGWLVPVDGQKLPQGYDLEDILKPVRDGLSRDGRLYALPFYAESSMTFYRTDLFEGAGVRMPAEPTWDQIRERAAKVHDPDAGVHGICLRGKPGWGENMALVSTLVNSFGGRWFDESWQAQLDSEAWRDAVNLYVDLVRNYGPPDATANGFNENLALFSEGRCGIWVDATIAAGKLFDPQQSKVVDKVGFAQAPVAETARGSHWLWSWALAVPASSDRQEAALEFMAWATSKEYGELVAEEEGWVAAPAGTRASLMESAAYRAAAPFAGFVQQAIETADPTLESAPYTGIQYVGIPEFQSIGTAVGQQIANALAGTVPVDEALGNAQWVTGKVIERARFLE